jgi:hypothetical protein
VPGVFSKFKQDSLVHSGKLISRANIDRLPDIGQLIQSPLLSLRVNNLEMVPQGNLSGLLKTPTTNLILRLVSEETSHTIMQSVCLWVSVCPSTNFEANRKNFMKLSTKILPFQVIPRAL